MLLLLKTPEGFALFKVLNEERLAAIKDLAKEFESAESARQIVKLEAFLKFVNTAEALEPAASLIKSQRHEGLRIFLNAHCDKHTLGVADPEIRNAIKVYTGIEWVHNSVVEKLMRGLQSQLTELISGLTGQVDTMIIQAIGLLDDRDEELNAHAKRLREWYGCHFPELDKIVQDNICYAKTVKLMGSRSNAANRDFSKILPEESVDELMKAAATSTGTEISELDLIDIREICDQVLSLSDYRSRLRGYLNTTMNTAAPNLTALVGELVGARLIAHAGSMMNLGKKSGSKIQMLGEGKHYNLIYHAPVLSQAPQYMKGSLARTLAAKVALTVRIDVCGDYKDNSFGVECLAKVEEMVRNAAKGGGQGGYKSADGKEVEAGEKKKKKRKHEEETDQPSKKQRKNLRAVQSARNREWREIRWSAPTPGWVKINTDGSSFGNPGVAGAGGVLRDDQGGWLGGFAHKVGFASSTKAEMWGALVGLQMAWDKGHRRVILETDSEDVRQRLSSNRLHLTSNDPVLEALRAMLSKDWEVEITHIYREGNMCADWMARRGRELPLGSHFYDSPPSDISPLLTRDSAGFSILRYCAI